MRRQVGEMGKETKTGEDGHCSHVDDVLDIGDFPKGAWSGSRPSHPGGQSAVGCGPGAATAGSSRRFACLQDDQTSYLD